MAIRSFLLAAGLVLVTSVPAVADSGHAPALTPAAEAQIALATRAIERYQDFEVAKAEGWKPFGSDEPLMGQHWTHPDRPDFTTETGFDFTRPTNLMYTEIDGQMVLAGVSYSIRIAPGEALPAGFAGDADLWHIHDVEKIRRVALKDRPLARWAFGRWKDKMMADGRTQSAMLHLWTSFANPDGAFTHHNRALPYMKAGLPASYADEASPAAARGISLATKDGCAATFDGRLWIAGASWGEKRAILGACAEAAERVRDALDAPVGELNVIAANAWEDLHFTYRATLDAEQLAKIDAIVDNPMGGGHCGF